MVVGRSQGDSEVSTPKGSWHVGLGIKEITNVIKWDSHICSVCVCVCVCVNYSWLGILS